MQPYNFPYFITLFSIALAGACYLYFSFHRTWIIWGNILMFILCMIRITTEYAIHLVDNLEIAEHIATFHSITATLNGYFLWTCVYVYIRPLRPWRHEAKFNNISIGVVITLFLAHTYPLYHRIIYQLLPERMDGHWVHTTNHDTFWLFYALGIVSVFSLATVAIFIYDIIKTKRKVVFKTILLISFFVLPTLLAKLVYIETPNQDYQIPNVGYIYLIHVTIVSWFCSDYRLFQSGFDGATKDILNSIADLTIYTNLDFRVQFINQAGKDFFDLTTPNIKIPELLAAYATLTSKEVHTAIEQLLSNQQDGYEVDLHHTERTMRARLQCKPFMRGQEQIGYIFIIHDLTDLRTNQELLERANQTKDQLFAIIGHDLRKPTLAFRGISSKINRLLARDDFHSLQQLGQHWESAANSLNHLVDNLLKWALQQRDVLPYLPERIELSLALMDSIEPLQNMLNHKNIKLTVDVPDNTQVLADFNALLTIMRNVIDNSIKFTPENGRIRVEAQATSKRVQISIRDTGIGMNHQQVEALFTIQKGKSRKGTAGESGTGIGLTLVKELVQTNQGELSVTSQPNQGTTINIVLPNAA
ncbi:MAG: ATP-binding protein [Saprospiraceae bacterium]